MGKCVSTAPARADCGSCPYFSGSVLPFFDTFFASIFIVFWTPLGPPKSEVGVRAGTPLNEFNSVHSLSSLKGPPRSPTYSLKGSFREPAAGSTEHPAAGVCVWVCSLKLDSSGLLVLLLRFLFV